MIIHIMKLNDSRRKDKKRFYIFQGFNYFNFSSIECSFVYMFNLLKMRKNVNVELLLYNAIYILQGILNNLCK